MTGHLTEQQAKEVLKKNTVGRIGYGNGKDICIVPVNYWYDGCSIVGHSHPGKKITVMRAHPDVCFEVDMIHAPRNWKSVIASGTYEEITDPGERWNAMKELMKRKLYVKTVDKAPVPESFGMRVHPKAEMSIILYKIVINKITGRYEIEDPEVLL